MAVNFKIQIPSPVAILFISFCLTSLVLAGKNKGEGQIILSNNDIIMSPEKGKQGIMITSPNLYNEEWIGHHNGNHHHHSHHHNHHDEHQHHKQPAIVITSGRGKGNKGNKGNKGKGKGNYGQDIMMHGMYQGGHQRMFF